MSQDTWHKLTNVNLKKKTATCSRCGVVGIRLKKIRGTERRTPKCAKALNVQRLACKQRQRDQRNPRANKKCKICGTTENICWDHDHVTGVFRGWLCRNCNIGLGYFKDDPEVLKNAIRYLRPASSRKDILK